MSPDGLGRFRPDFNSPELSDSGHGQRSVAMGQGPRANPPRHMIVAPVLLGLIGDLSAHLGATHRGGPAAPPGPGRLML